MRRSLVSSLALVLGLAACGGDRARPLAHHGFEPGMSAADFRKAVASVGALSCEPFRVEGVAANQLCSTADSSGLRVVAVLGAATSPVPYVVVQEPDSGGHGFAELTRSWGAPDTLVESGRRWRRGPWLADADTVGGRFTVWLTDTATDNRITLHRIAAQRALSDTAPVQNDLRAVLDTIRLTSPAGAPFPASAAEVETPPRVVGCRQAPVPAELAAVTGSVLVMYVVDTAGRAEPASVRVLEASRRGFIAPAVATIGSCTYRPGRQGGKALRVLVQQRVGFRPK